jgi:hypothetical protein
VSVLVHTVGEWSSGVFAFFTLIQETHDKGSIFRPIFDDTSLDLSRLAAASTSMRWASAVDDIRGYFAVGDLHGYRQIAAAE